MVRKPAIARSRQRRSNNVIAPQISYIAEQNIHTSSYSHEPPPYTAEDVSPPSYEDAAKKYNLSNNYNTQYSH